MTIKLNSIIYHIQDVLPRTQLTDLEDILTENKEFASSFFLNSICHETMTTLVFHLISVVYLLCLQKLKEESAFSLIFTGLFM